MVTKKIIRIFILGSIFLSGASFGLETPKSGILDKRIKSITYNSNEVVKLVGHYGYATHIQLSSNEVVDKIVFGDPKAWNVAPVKNHIFLKAVGIEAETNMTVLTNRFVYNFQLEAHKSTQGSMTDDMFFQIKFLYPQDKKLKSTTALDNKKVKSNLNASDQLPVKNYDYWAKGSKSLIPSKIFDDRRFTYLTFPNHKEMPAIYMVNDDDSESLVNTHIDPKKPNTIAAHIVTKQLVLRKGNVVTCIFNKSILKNTAYKNTGTTSNKVKRVIKAQGKELSL